MRGVGASTRIFELKDRPTAIRLTGGESLPQIEGRITLDRVHFRYPTRPEAPIFADLSMTFQPG